VKMGDSESDKFKELYGISVSHIKELRHFTMLIDIVS
jgi:hypothetical protein